MHLQCPHCHNPIELVETSPKEEVVCPSCGSSFRLAQGSTTPWTPREGQRRLGRYELLDTVGVGAFGTVYKARDLQLHRVVAIKVPRAANLADSQDLDRFLREARSVSQLSHPGIVPIYDAGEAEGTPYLVSEFVQGVTLADQLTARRPTPQEAAQMIAALADALHYAHEQGVVHRDVKPSNILLEADGSPRLMDFGLAKRDAGEITMTLDGQVLGTPAYMSPEQARGEGHKVDGRSDGYSLGVILYQLLTGELPFRGNTRMLLHQVLHDEPRSPRSLNDRIPRDLETICLKAMAKEPGRRYATAHDLADDLRRFLKGEPIRARPVGKTERVWRWCRRNPAVAALTSLMLILLVCVAVGATGSAIIHAQLAADNQDARDQALKEQAIAQRARDAEAAARKTAEAKEQEARANLRTALFHEAEALRQSLRAGHRQTALDALKRAAAIRPGLDLRNEFLRCLDLPDLRLLPVKVLADKGPFVSFRATENVVLTRGRPGFLASGELEPPAEYDLSTGKRLREFKGLGSLNPVAHSRDGRLIAATKSGSKGVQLWDVDARKALGELKDSAGNAVMPFLVAFSDAADVLAAATRTGVEGRQVISLYDSKFLRVLGSWEVQADNLDCLRFSPAGNTLAGSVILSPMTHAVRLWSVPVGKELVTLPIEKIWSWSTAVKPARIDFSPDGRKLVAMGGAGTIKMWAVARQAPLVPKETFSLRAYAGFGPEGALAARFSPDGRWLATLGEAGWEVGTTEKPDVFVLSGSRYQLKLWDVKTGLLVAQTPAGRGGGSHLEWSPSGSYLSSDGELWQFDRPLLREYSGRDPDGPPEAARLEFSPADRWLVCNRQRILLIDLHHPDLAQPFLQEGGGGSWVDSLAFAPGGDRFWKESPDTAGLLWQLPSPKPASAPGHKRTQHVVATAFNAQGQRIAAGAEKALELKMIDLKTGKEIWNHPEQAAFDRDAHPYRGPPRFTFSPDSKQLAAGLLSPEEAKVKVWDIVTTKILYERADPKGPLFFRGQSLMALSDGKTLAVRDLQADKLLEPMRPPARDDFSFRGGLLFSDDGLLCAETTAKGAIVIWDFAKKALRTKIERAGFPREHTDPQAFNRDGSRIAALDGDHLKVWDTRTGKPLGELRAKPAVIVFGNTAEDAEKLLLVDGEPLRPVVTVSSWRPGDKEAQRICTWKGDSASYFDPRLIAFSADRKRAVVVFPATQVGTTTGPAQSSGVPTVYVYQLPAGSQLSRFALKLTSLDNNLLIAVDPDASKLAVLHQYETPKAWNCDTGQELLHLQGSGYNLRLSRDGAYCAFTSQAQNEGFTKVFDLNDGSEISSTSLPHAPGGILLAEQARWLACFDSRQVTIYDPRTGKKVTSIEGDVSDLGGWTFDGSGQVLAGASWRDGTVRLWNAATGELLATLQTGHQQQITGLALSPSGRWLATGDLEGQVHLWDLAQMRRQLKDAGLDWSTPAITVTPSPDAGTAAALLEEAQRHHLFEHYAEAVQAYNKSLALDRSQAVPYRDRGEALFQLRKYAEAAADFEKAKELTPDLSTSESFPLALRYRGVTHAESGQWDKATADFAKANQVGGGKGNTAQENALLLLAAADLKGYAKACDSLLNHLPEKPDAATANPMLWTCVLGPNALSDYTRLQELAEDGVDSHPKEWKYQHTLGAVLYRADRFVSAIDRLDRAIKVAGNEGQPRDWLFLAMAYHRLGHPDEARPWLDKAVRGIYEAKTAQLSWSQRLELLLLRREAETLIKGMASEPKK